MNIINAILKMLLDLPNNRCYVYYLTRQRLEEQNDRTNS